MVDVLHKIAALNNERAEYAEGKLNDLADGQRDSLSRKKEIRGLQEQYDRMVADGVVHFATEDGKAGDLYELGRMIQDAGLSEEIDMDAIKKSMVHSKTGYYLEKTDGKQGAKDAAKNAKAMENLEKALDRAMEKVEDGEATLQFEIQMGTSELTTAENQRASAEKLLADTRKELVNKWAG